MSQLRWKFVTGVLEYNIDFCACEPRCTSESENIQYERKVTIYPSRLNKVVISLRMLAGSTVLVTGCSRGLGLEMTRQLLTRYVQSKLLQEKKTYFWIGLSLFHP